MTDRLRHTLRLLPDKQQKDTHVPVPSRPSPLRAYRIMTLGANAAAQAPTPADPPVEQPKRLEPVTQFLSTDVLLARREMLPPGPIVSADLRIAAPPLEGTSKFAPSDAVHTPSRARKILLTLALTVAVAAAVVALVAAVLVRRGESVQTAVRSLTARAAALNAGSATPSPSLGPPHVEGSNTTPPPEVRPLAVLGKGPAPGTKGSTTRQRAASDALAAGDFETALEIYRELALSSPGRGAYEKAAQILERRVSADRARSEVTP